MNTIKFLSIVFSDKHQIMIIRRNFMVFLSLGMHRPNKKSQKDK